MLEFSHRRRSTRSEWKKNENRLINLLRIQAQLSIVCGLPFMQRRYSQAAEAHALWPTPAPCDCAGALPDR